MTPVFALEWILTACLVGLALAAPGLRASPFLAQCLRRASLAFRQLAGRKPLVVCVVIGLALAGRALLLPVMPIRVPLIHDEFSYLLAGDTFASGRLTNPPHPMWVHLETFHVLQQPTYASMQHPMQGLILAAGQVLGGHPWWGVWASTALLCGALCWMLQGWMPPGWALLGGIVAVVRIGWFSYWMNSYWGGAPAALGGALVLGALPRLRERPLARYALLLGVGLVILANSRPWEGLLFSLPVAAFLAAWAFSASGPSAAVLIPRVLIPMLLLLSLAAGGMMHYYRSVTGSAFRMPYEVNRETYAQARHFLWQTPRPAPVYRHAAFSTFYGDWEMQAYYSTRTAAAMAWRTLTKFKVLWIFFVGPALTPALIALPWVLRKRRMRLMLALLLSMTVAFTVLIWPENPHYAAPMTGVFYILLMECMRHLRAGRWGWMRPTGKQSEPPVLDSGTALVSGMIALCLLMAGLRTAVQLVPGYRGNLIPTYPLSWCCTDPGNFLRAEILARLQAMPGQHLAIVRYGAEHSVHVEWVYNDAKIDQAKVVWAREMGAGKDAELLRYFHNRRVWLVDADRDPPTLSPYPN